MFLKNILSNYFSQFYITIIGICFIPIIYRQVGSETYGLIGFFATLQICFGILDLGITSTVGRETSRYVSTHYKKEKFYRVLKLFEIIFFIISIFFILIITSASFYLSTEWLTPKLLTVTEVRISIQIMGLYMGIRWMSGFYKAIINGNEKFKWLGTINSIIGTLRFIVIVPILLYISDSPIIYFTYQLIIGLIEIIVFHRYVAKLFPGRFSVKVSTRSFVHLAPLIRFSLSVGISSVIWVITSQADKILLSKYLSLDNYGFFTIAITIASIVIQFTGPIAAPVMARLATLEGVLKHKELEDVYKTSTQFVVVIVSALIVNIIVYSRWILRSWTGDDKLANYSENILIIYSIGNGIAAISAFTYYLQYAKGNLDKHLIGQLIYLVLYIPLLYYFTIKFGAVGAGSVYTALNFTYLLIFSNLVNAKFMISGYKNWFIRDVICISFPILFLFYNFHFEIYDVSFHKQIILVLINIVISILFGLLLTSKIQLFIKSKISII